MKTYSYGLTPDHVFDLYLPTGKGPFPCAIYFHGGAFRTGDRVTGLLPGVMERYRAMGWAFISASYPLNIDGPNGAVWPEPYENGQRLVQTVRHRALAGQLPIIPGKMIVLGLSAGASIAQHVAYAPDAADPDSTFGWKRASSRVSGVIAVMAQTTYCPNKLEAIFGDDISTVAEWVAWFHGVATAAEIDPANDLCDPIRYRGSDSPAAWYAYLPLDGADIYHDPRMSQEVLRDPLLNRIEVTYSGAIDLARLEIFSDKAIGRPVSLSDLRPSTGYAIRQATSIKAI